jgi:hypothetical protein
MKFTISWIRTMLVGINARLNAAEGKISDPEDIAIAIIQNETRRKKREFTE